MPDELVCEFLVWDPTEVFIKDEAHSKKKKRATGKWWLKRAFPTDIVFDVFCKGTSHSGCLYDHNSHSELTNYKSQSFSSFPFCSILLPPVPLNTLNLKP